ncbi:MAG: RNA-binding domain-containing protein [Methanobacterium sp.]
MNAEIYAKADLNPTEDMEKVIEAIANVIEYNEIEVGDGYVCASGDMETIKNLGDELKIRKIRSAARKIMLKGSNNGKIHFKLSKQAALVGALNLVEDDLSPLGEIEVEIKTEDVKNLIDLIAPEIIE